MNKDNLENKCFIEWRGDIKRHRSYDVMISERDIDWIREGINQRAQRFCKDIQMPEEGAVIAFGERCGDPMTKVGAEAKFSICTGKGPKLVVNPEYKGEPARISELRDDVKSTVKVRKLFRLIYEHIDWQEIHDNVRNLDNNGGLLLSFPKKLLPVNDKGLDRKRSGYQKELIDALISLFEARYNEEFPLDKIEIRINRDMAEIWMI